MKKLRLELDALAVESFATGAGPGDRLGTVRGAAVARCNTCANDCDPLTCGPSCIGACTSDAQQQQQAGTITNDPSYLQTCRFYTCGGCTTADPAYCPPTDQ